MQEGYTGRNYPGEHHLGEATKANGTYINSVYERLSKLNSEQRGLINEVENKVSRISVLKDNSEAAINKSGDPHDFIQSMNTELDYMQYQNQRLERLLKHLDEIV